MALVSRLVFDLWQSRVQKGYPFPTALYAVTATTILIAAQIIMLEASVSFLGMGVPPPTPTWGQMLGGTARAFMTQAPWMATAPGLTIWLTVLAFTMLGVALRGVWDAKLGPGHND
jgi:peptide/nickel transport system permease protein